ncbi:hypothetical protein D3H55_13510 [Bacillus salacetis]|uniref:Uncharacterized protein n=1 Tax=Bacillus salacetis TaxID=2315464 RepID=A0A3A1QVX0_9BACI|nr:hypothetical protein D3H55_13510 [Bacillus salacetis]
MSYSSITGTLMKLLIRIIARSRTNSNIHRFCSRNYELHTSKGIELSPKEYIRKENIEYIRIKDSSIVETDNNIGLFTYQPHLFTNRLLLKALFVNFVAIYYKFKYYPGNSPKNPR